MTIDMDMLSSEASIPVEEDDTVLDRDDSSDEDSTSEVEMGISEQQELGPAASPPEKGESPLLDLPAEFLDIAVRYVFAALPNGRPARILPLYGVRGNFPTRLVSIQRNKFRALAILRTCRIFYEAAFHTAYTEIEWNLKSYGPIDNRNTISGFMQQPGMTADQASDIRYILGDLAQIRQFLNDCDKHLHSVQADRLHLALVLDPFLQNESGVIKYLRTRTENAVYECLQILEQRKALKTMTVLLQRPSAEEVVDLDDEEAVQSQATQVVENHLHNYTKQHDLEHCMEVEGCFGEVELRLTISRAKSTSD